MGAWQTIPQQNKNAARPAQALYALRLMSASPHERMPTVV